MNETKLREIRVERGRLIGAKVKIIECKFGVTIAHIKKHNTVSTEKPHRKQKIKKGDNLYISGNPTAIEKLIAIN
jgi:Trk K+ transport system NAD-binding subunit